MLSHVLFCTCLHSLQLSYCFLLNLGIKFIFSQQIKPEDLFKVHKHSRLFKLYKDDVKLVTDFNSLSTLINHSIPMYLVRRDWLITEKNPAFISRYSTIPQIFDFIELFSRYFNGNKLSYKLFPLHRVETYRRRVNFGWTAIASLPQHHDVNVLLNVAHFRARIFYLYRRAILGADGKSGAGSVARGHGPSLPFPSPRPDPTLHNKR